MSTRPSEIYAIEDEFVAFCFDRAVRLFGNSLENRLQEISKSSKKQKEAERKIEMELSKWLSSDLPDGRRAAGRFRDPVATT